MFRGSVFDTRYNVQTYRRIAYRRTAFENMTFSLLWVMVYCVFHIDISNEVYHSLLTSIQSLTESWKLAHITQDEWALRAWTEKLEAILLLIIRINYNQSVLWFEREKKGGRKKKEYSERKKQNINRKRNCNNKQINTLEMEILVYKFIFHFPCQIEVSSFIFVRFSSVFFFFRKSLLLLILNFIN